MSANMENIGGSTIPPVNKQTANFRDVNTTHISRTKL